jgi:hypothetical protein
VSNGATQTINVGQLVLITSRDLPRLEVGQYLGEDQFDRPLVRLDNGPTFIGTPDELTPLDIPADSVPLGDFYSEYVSRWDHLSHDEAVWQAVQYVTAGQLSDDTCPDVVKIATGLLLGKSPEVLVLIAEELLNALQAVDPSGARRIARRIVGPPTS